jgi:hypothetical protein
MLSEQSLCLVVWLFGSKRFEVYMQAVAGDTSASGLGDNVPL